MNRWLVGLLLCTSGTAWAKSPEALDLKVSVTGILLDDLKAAVDGCTNGTKTPAAVAKLLGLPPEVVSSDTACHFLQDNIRGAGQPDDLFNFSTPSDNGGRYQTIIIFSKGGERVGVYHAQNFPLEVDVIASSGDPHQPSELHLSGNGKWLDEDLSWEGSFRLVNGQFDPVPDENGNAPPKPRCPSSQPISFVRQTGVHRADVKATICGDGSCYLDCVDKKNQTGCAHDIGGFWLGSFSQPDALEVMVEMQPAAKDHRSSLHLMQATACGWKSLGSISAFAGSQDSCTEKRVVDHDVLVCRHTEHAADDTTVGTVSVYMARDGELQVDTPLRTLTSPACHAGQLVSSTVADIAFDEANSNGIVRANVQVDAAEVKWKSKGRGAEACTDATLRMTQAITGHTVHLELSRDGFRAPVNEVERLHQDPIPGVELR